MTNYSFRNSGSTNVVTVFAFLATGLLPYATAPLPHGNSDVIAQYKKIRPSDYKLQSEVLLTWVGAELITVAKTLLANSKDDDAEIAHLTNEAFWEI